MDYILFHKYTGKEVICNWWTTGTWLFAQ